MPQTDEQLMRRCSLGDKAAFEELAARYRPRLEAMARTWLGSSELASETAQDVLVAAFERRALYEERGPFASWLFALAANHLRDLHRARSRRQRAMGRMAEDASPGNTESVPVDAVMLWDALGGLPANQRAALLLHDLYGFEHAEIAALFGVAAGTVRSWTTRARGQVRRQLMASDYQQRRKRG